MANDVVAAIGTPVEISGVTFKANKVQYPFFYFEVELDEAAIPVTDGAGSGSHGALKLFDFNPGSVMFLASRQNYTAVTESEGVSGGDTVFDIGLGTAAIAAAADGVLSGSATYDNIGAKVDGTLSSGALQSGTPITVHDNSNAIVDGTATALDMVLNWSGTAATVDASGTVYVTGTVTVAGIFMGDD